MQQSQYIVYIMSNCRRTVYYVGVTNTIERRVHEHVFRTSRNSFTAQYNVNELLHCEIYRNPGDAIKREKQLKGWRREKKLKLVQAHNPEMRNLIER